jgi:threonine/homoserine/homoserine lactone efflux protein
MTDLLPHWPLFVAFLIASFILAITPGPGVLYIVTCSAKHGRRLGLASVAGVACGNLGNALGASLGLAALFAISTLAFSVVKYGGAAYLIYLGIKALRASSPTTPTENVVVPRSSRRAFGEGFLVALLNPKTAMFFAAFLPQFVDTPSALPQTVILSVIFVTIAASTDSLYALGAGTLGPWLTQRPSIGVMGKYLSGGVFIALGLLAAYSSRSSFHKG